MRQMLRKHAATVLTVAFFVAVIPFLARTYGVSRDYWLMNDQIRDWDLVQTSFASLPVTGTPRSGGGYHVGPAYYHFLWLSRIVVGPLLGNLPHAAGITVTTVDVAGAFALTIAMSRIGVPLLGALASGLLLVTNPYASALSRAGWNPALALAFSNLAVALFLLRYRRWKIWHQALLSGLCWAAVEMHTAAFPVAFSLILITIVIDGGPGGPRRACLIAMSALVILLLQLPPLLAGLPADAEVESSVSLSLERLAADPGVLFNDRGLRFVVGEGAHQLLLATPASLSQSAWILIAAVSITACAVLVNRLQRGIALAAIGPLAIAAMAFTILDRELEAYWLIPLLGIYSLVVTLPLLAFRERWWARLLGGVFLVGVLLTLPARWAHFRSDHRYPLYGTLVSAASDIARQGIQVRALIGPSDHFRPTSSSPLVRWQGGALSGSARLVARVSRNGDVSFFPADGD